MARLNSNSGNLEGVEWASLWASQVEPLPDRTGRELPDAADVVVVGGGYTGLSAALALGRRGARATVLEAEHLGWGASTRNGGMILPGYKLGPRALGRKVGEEPARELYRDSVAAVEHVARLIADEGIRADHDPRGYLELAWGVDKARDFSGLRDEFATVGIPSRVIPRDELRAEIGTDAYHGGLLVEVGGGLHPARFHRGLVDAADRVGADLHEGVRVRSIRAQADGRYVVETSRGALLARDVIVATNGYTDGVAPDLRRRVIPIGSYIIATEVLPDDLARSISPRGRMFFDTKHFLFYWRLTPDRRLLFGGRASFAPTSVARTARTLVRGMLEVHPQLADVRVEYAWGGNVGFTFDRLPHAGRTSNGVFYATGCCGSGVAMLTYLGARVGAWVGGDAPPAITRQGFPVVPVPWEGRPWFLPIAGEWYRLHDRRARRGAAEGDAGSPGAEEGAHQAGHAASDPSPDPSPGPAPDPAGDDSRQS